MPKFPLDEYKTSERLSINVGTTINIPEDTDSIGRYGRAQNGHSAHVSYNLEIGEYHPKVGEVRIDATLNGKTPKETAEMLIETLEHALNVIRVQLSEKGVL